MGASALVHQRIVDPKVMESIAYREGMALTSNLRVDGLRLASDCLNVVKSIREINVRKTTFRCVEFVHEHRDSNTGTHIR